MSAPVPYDIILQVFPHLDKNTIIQCTRLDKTTARYATRQLERLINEENSEYIATQIKKDLAPRRYHFNGAVDRELGLGWFYGGICGELK